MRRTTSVSAMAVLDLHDLLLAMGVATPAQMQAVGLNREALIDADSIALPIQEQRLDESLLLALWQVAVSNSDIPHIGLAVGQVFNPDTRGVLASWLFQCARLSEALGVFHQYIALMNPSESWAVSEAEENLLLEFAFAPEKHYPRAAIERSMSALLRWSQEMTGERVTPTACEFAFPRPVYHERYVEVFGANLHFGAGRNCLHLPRALLSQPVRGANGYLRRIIEARALQTFEQLQFKDELLGKVRGLIQENLRQGVDIRLVCQALHVSRPTLYRRLRREGTSFTELVTSVRKNLAYKRIQQGLAVAAVSEELGFKDVSTFHRAFKRWFKQSPGLCRAAGEY